MAIADPRDVPGLVAWYSADSLASDHADGSAVTTWPDLSGNGRHATAVGTAPVFLATGGRSGGPAVEFSRSSANGFQLPADVMAGAVAGEVAAVIRSGATGEEGLWAFGADGAAQSHFPYSGWVYDSFGTTSRYDFGPITTSTWYGYQVSSKAGSWKAWTDGTLRKNQPSNDVAFRSILAFGQSRGSGITSGTAFGGRFGCLLLWNRELTDTERADVQAWMVANPSGGSAGASTPTPITVTGAQASETDAAQAGSAKAGTTRTGGQAAEADTPQAGSVSTGQIAPGGTGTETDTAQGGTTKAGTVRTGGQGAETDTAQGGSVPGDMVTVDLSTFTGLYATTAYDGTKLYGSPLYFTFADLVLDHATEYVVEVDYAHTGSAYPGVVELYAIPAPTDAGSDAAVGAMLAGTSTLAGTGTVSFTIGPGHADWEMAVAAGEHYFRWFTGNVDITGIRVAPAMDGEVPPPPLPEITRRPTSGRSRGGRAAVLWEPPVVQPPITVPGVTLPRTIGAVAYSATAIAGTAPTFTTEEATKTRTRHRILVGGKDVSFYRGVETPEPSYELAEPLLWGPATLVFPQIVACFENPGKGDLRWCRKGASVVVQRVTAEGEVVSVDYRGVVLAYDTSGADLRIQVGGHAQGRAALRHKPLPIFKDTLDVGRLGWAAIRDLGLRFEPRLGPTTGIRSALFGGMDYLTYISELCAKAWQRDGTQWTIMPSDAGVYRMKRKDTTTIDFTVFTDDERAFASLRSDAAEEHNRIFATGTTPKGQRVRFGVYPQLKPGPAAPYPFADGRNFGPGTTDADTDTGDGVFVMIRKLWAAGYLSLEDASGEYDADVAKAIAALQDEAQLELGPVGVMTAELWPALFDIEGQWTLRGARIEPAAQAPRTRRYRRSASGSWLGKNPKYDPHALVVDRIIDFGAGFTRNQMREWARAEIARGEDNWLGTIKITTGAVLHGDVPLGASIDGDSLMDVRAIKPGMNARLPLFAGGITVHVSAVQITYDGEIPIATLTVDTQARDALPVWEIIRRNRETRRDPARRWHPNRASGEMKDSVTEWDEVGGVLYGDRELVAGWNVFPVVAGQEGSVSRMRLVVHAPGSKDGKEFAVAVFGKRITAARLNHLVSRPLANSVIANPETDEDDEDEPTPPPLIGDRAWERRSVRKILRKKWHVYSVGTYKEPCGYSPGRKTWTTTTSQQPNPAYNPDADKNSTGTDDDEFISVSTTTAHGKLTGVHEDDAGFSYRTDRQPVLYLAVYVRSAAVLEGGRVMWPQLEAGA